MLPYYFGETNIFIEFKFTVGRRSKSRDEPSAVPHNRRRTAKDTTLTVLQLFHFQESDTQCWGVTRYKSNALL